MGVTTCGFQTHRRTADAWQVQPLSSSSVGSPAHPKRISVPFGWYTAPGFCDHLAYCARLFAGGRWMLCQAQTLWAHPQGNQDPMYGCQTWSKCPVLHARHRPCGRIRMGIRILCMAAKQGANIPFCTPGTGPVGASAWESGSYVWLPNREQMSHSARQAQALRAPAWESGSYVWLPNREQMPFCMLNRTNSLLNITNAK
jgi:hypothetical protein